MLFFTILFLPFLVNAIVPSKWDWYTGIHGHCNLPGMQDRPDSIVIAGQQATDNIWQLTAICKTQQGRLVAVPECQHSVITTGIAMGMSAMYWRTATTWASAGGPGATSRRSLQAAANTFLSDLPPHLKISNVKLSNVPLALNTASSKILKRDAAEYNVFYNGSLPLTFILHHPLASNGSDGATANVKRDNEEEEDHIPIFAATNGHQLYITHITPLNTSTPLLPRSGFNGYDHVGVGGLKVQANSDQVTLWGEVMNWLGKRTESGNQLTPYDIFLWAAGYGMWIGHSFTTDARDFRGFGYNGQFMIEGETNPFQVTWEPGWNWCFGSHPTNCNGLQQD